MHSKLTKLEYLLNELWREDVIPVLRGYGSSVAYGEKSCKSNQIIQYVSWICKDLNDFCPIRGTPSTIGNLSPHWIIFSCISSGFTGIAVVIITNTYLNWIFAYKVTLFPWISTRNSRFFILEEMENCHLCAIICVFHHTLVLHRWGRIKDFLQCWETLKAYAHQPLGIRSVWVLRSGGRY